MGSGRRLRAPELLGELGEGLGECGGGGGRDTCGCPRASETDPSSERPGPCGGGVPRLSGVLEAAGRLPAVPGAIVCWTYQAPRCTPGRPRCTPMHRRPHRLPRAQQSPPAEGRAREPSPATRTPAPRRSLADEPGTRGRNKDFGVVLGQ